MIKIEALLLKILLNYVASVATYLLHCAGVDEW